MTLVVSQKTSHLCCEVNGGSCRNLVSSANDFVCAAGHKKLQAVRCSELEVARSSLSSVQDLDRLARKQISQTTKISIIHNPHVASFTVEYFLKDEDAFVRAEVARSNKIRDRYLKSACFDPSYIVRKASAQNPKLSPALFSLLAQDEEPEVRSGLCHNPALPVEVAKILSSDPDPYVRRNLAGSSIQDIAIISALAKDSVPYVRGVVGDNKSLATVKAVLAKPSILYCEPYESFIYRLVELAGQEAGDREEIFSLVKFCRDKSLSMGGLVDHYVNEII